MNSFENTRIKQFPIAPIAAPKNALTELAAPARSWLVRHSTKKQGIRFTTKKTSK